MRVGHLYSADNLDVLRGGYIPPESVDLIYLDPPFNSKRDYNIIYQERDESPARGQIKAFEDYWHWDANARDMYEELIAPDAPARGVPPALSMITRALHDSLPKRSDMFAYLVMMAPRLVELRRVLKQTGSLYLHCDPTASHYLKLVLDAIFGPQCFRNEIVWQRTGAHGRAKRWGPIHDTILFYSRSDKFTWNRTYQDYDPSYVEKFYRFTDEHGRYRLVTLNGPGTRNGDSGKPWGGDDPTSKGRHWELPPDRALPPWFVFPRGYSKMTIQQRLDVLDKATLIYWPTRGSVPQYKRYLCVSEGNSLQDVVTDIPPLSPQAAERLRYPTQKPLALLERIIKASSSEGDVVLDPFCGCGTAIEAAHKLGREWIGIDITHLAIDVVRERLAEKFPGKISYRLFSIPSDLETARALAKDGPYEFQFWAARKIGAFIVGPDPHAREGKRGSDRGVDGLIRFRSNDEVEEAVVSVKGGHVGAPAVRDLRGTMERRGAPIGIFVTMQEPTQPMRDEATDAGFIRRGEDKFPRIQLLTIADILDGKRPLLPGQRERAPAVGQNLTLPGMALPPSPPPRGVLITVPARPGDVVTPTAGAERKPPLRVPGPARKTRQTDVERS